MRSILFAILATAGMAAAAIDPSVPSSYVDENIVDARIQHWFSKSGTNDIVFHVEGYPMGFQIPGTDKTEQTIFLMAVQNNVSLSFYVTSVEASQWWATGWFGHIDNFRANF